MNDLAGRNVLVAVGGGIAAYKVVELVRRLMKRGAEVRVIMTPSATRFVHPTTFAAISGREVGVEMFAEEGRARVDHLEAPHRADLVVAAPATANLLARMAAGMGDDLVTTALLAARCPVLAAPAMNSSMWDHPATRANIETLRQRGIHFIGPEAGEMAAPGEDPGVGRMSEPVAIESEVVHLLQAGSGGELAGKTVLVTAGRTEEPVDSVRVLTNRSSGRMGVEVARAARRRGAKVVLVHGVLEVAPPAGVELVRATTARQMLEAVRERVAEADAALYVAAVSDWRPASEHEGKLSREGGDSPAAIELVENPDIAAETAGAVRGVAVGFALEMSGDEERARRKLAKKGLDAILLNTAEAIGAERNRLTWIPREGSVESSPEGLKAALADWLVDRVVKALKPSG